MKSWQSSADIRLLLLRQGKYMILITLAPWNRVLWTKNTAKEKHPSVLMQLFISICQNVINNLVKRNVSQSNLIENKVRDVVVSLQLIAVSGVASSWYERIFRTGVIFVISRHKGGIWDYIHCFCKWESWVLEVFAYIFCVKHWAPGTLNPQIFSIFCSSGICWFHQVIEQIDPNLG